jgi:PAS domain S-box-containing protein
MKPAPLPDREAERLRILRELRFDETGIAAALAAIARLAARHSGWPVAGVSLVDEQRQWFAAVAGRAPSQASRESSLCARVLFAEGPFEVFDAAADERFTDSPLVKGTPPVRAYAAMPLEVDGQRIGAVCVMDDRRPNRLDEQGWAALKDVAGLATSLLEGKLRTQRAELQEARIREASRAGNDWLWESSAEGVMTWVSESVETHAGWAPGAEVGQHARLVVRPHPQHAASWDRYLQARAEHRAFKDIVAQRDSRRGVISVSFSGMPVFDAAGCFCGYRGATRDVTGELALRAQALAAQELLQGAMEHIPASLMISDPQGRIVLSNKAWRESIAPYTDGRTQTWEALLREMVSRGGYPDAAGREDEFIAWRLSVVDRPLLRHEMRFGELYVLTTDQRLADGSIVHMSVDITERKRAELKLAEQDAQLRASQERMRAVLRSVPDLWFVVDGESRYVACSDEHHPWLVQAFDRLRGRRFAELGTLHPLHSLEGAVGQVHVSGEVQRIEYEAVIADGSRHDFEARVSPMDGGQALFLLRDLTELRTLERHVRLLQRALEADAALPMMIVDASRPDMPISYVNTAFERLTGYSSAEAMDRNCRFLQGDGREQPGLDVLRRALARGEAATVVLNNRRKDDSVYTVELHVAPVHDSGGVLTHYIGVLSDVTERSRAADRLRLSEALYRSVADAISDGLVVIGANGRIVTANPTACALMNCPAERLVGQHIGRLGFRLTHEDGRPLARAEHPVRRVLDGGPSAQGRVHRLICPDGRELLLRLSVQPLMVSPQDPRPSCVLTCHDIGAQRLAERALRQAEARWNFALDGAGYGVWDHDEDSGTVFFSRRWKEMLGYADGEPMNRLQEWTHRIHPDDHPRVIEAIERHRRGETAEYETQHRLRHKDGHWIWVLDRAKIVERRADGSPRRVVGTHSDITRQKLADRALRDQQASELASRAKSEFLSRMSHEMRTPLNAVIGFAQLLRMQGKHDQERLGRYSEHILQAGQHLLALVNDVLDLQQVEEGHLSLELAAIPLAEALTTALDMVRPMADERAITIDARVDSGVQVRADAQRLRQVLLNVLSNAVKYNRDGGTLSCHLETAGRGRCAFVIEDSGAGLTTEQVARLFQPFERLGLETSGVEGSGLGLIISRRLMTGMHGALSLSSRPGLGTRVRLELPLANAGRVRAGEAGGAAQGQKVKAPAAPGTLAAPAPTAPGTVAAVRMLYVEDNPVNAILFEEAIKLRGGVELRVAQDGAEGLEMVERWQPDVLVLDAHLPGMSGYEVLARLRRHPGLADTPAFMCSADAMPEDLERARRAGFAGYWTKPIDIAHVMSDLDALHRVCSE